MRESFTNYLEQEYLQRKGQNASYSWRAFVRHLGVDQSTLSKCLKGDREFSWPTIEQCLQKLSAPNEVINRFKEEREILFSDYTELEEDHFAALADWKYWAILEYLKMDKSPSDCKLAERFHIEVEEVEKILLKLSKLGFIRKDDEEYKLLKPNNTWVDNAKTSCARKELQRKLAKLSQAAIDEVEVDSRYHGSLTVAIDKDKLPLIKEKISAFQAEIGQFLQKKSNLNEVYQLTISFFPLTKNQEQ
jgi:uncharacterized protein (TIGR02147 family)